MPRVYNKRGSYPKDAVYVGRPTKWGNPFVIGKDGTRSEVVSKYKTLAVTSPSIMDSLDELKGKDLVCWCAPQACHADVLLELANKAGDNE